MTYRNYILLSLVFLSTSAFTQSHFVGLQGGLSSATNLGTLGNYVYRNGYEFALSYQYRQNKFVFFGADLAYSLKGFRNAILITDNNGNVTGQLNTDWQFEYISIPIKAGMNVGTKFGIFFSLAIAPAYLIHGSNKTDSNPYFLAENFDFTDKANRFDLYGQLEAGLFFRIARKVHFGPILQYQQSLATWTNKDFFEQESSYHASFLFAFTLKYQIGK